MDYTVIRNQRGQVVGAIEGRIHNKPPATSARGDHAGPMASPGQSFERVTVSDEFADMANNPDLFAKLMKHLATAAANPAAD